MTIAYLASQYPAPSHTFIRREIAALRGLGLQIRPYSIQRGQAVAGDPLSEAAARETFAVQAASSLSVVGASLGALAARPGRFLSTLGLALRHRVPGARALLWSLFHFGEAMLLARRLRGDGVTHLHNHFANSGATVGMLAARYLGIPWSLTLHGISEFDYPAGNLLAAKIERAAFVACVSRFGMAQAMRLTQPALWPRLSIVRCAIDPGALPASAPAKTPFQLISVGRLSPEKGQSGLLESVAQAAAAGTALHLTLVGDGPEEQRLHARAADLGIAELVTFAGRLDERATLKRVAESDALILPSFMEGLPIVLMEAMAIGVPVIASRVAGIPELVEDGVSGLLVTPADWDALGEAIGRLAADPTLRTKLAAGARERVAAEFTYPDAARPLLGLFGGTGDAEQPR